MQRFRKLSDWEKGLTNTWSVWRNGRNEMSIFNEIVQINIFQLFYTFLIYNIIDYIFHNIFTIYTQILLCRQNFQKREATFYSIQTAFIYYIACVITTILLLKSMQDLSKHRISISIIFVCEAPFHLSVSVTYFVQPYSLVMGK